MKIPYSTVTFNDSLYEYYKGTHTRVGFKFSSVFGKYLSIIF
jgi:hypothetical protein